MNVSQLTFSLPVPLHLQSSILALVEIPVTTQLGTYLGTPLFTSPKNELTLIIQLIVLVMKCRGGKQNIYLCMAGKLTLIKDVT